MLSISDLRVYYGKSEAVHNVSLNVKSKEIVALIGANGAGKTSILKAIMGMQKPVHGVISLNNRDISKGNSAEIAGLGVSIVHEGRGILRTLSVEENLELGAYLCSRKMETRRRLHEVYEFFPRLSERKRQSAGSLSGGEQQMLAIGRSLMSNPKLILMDEPSLGLAPLIIEEIMGLMLKIKNLREISILLVEQNGMKALQLSDRAYVLENGVITMEGDSKVLRNDKRVIDAYLGGTR